MNFLWGLVLVVVFLGVILALLYNGLVRSRNRVREAWADIEVQLKRRHNLIPNLVETVKGYAAHEKGVFEEVTKARSQAMQATGRGDRAQGENMLSDALKSLFAVAENYPDLKASNNFLELQRELRDAEDKIQAARRFYNTNVRDYNTSIESVPTNMVAMVFNFKQEELFQIEVEAERGVPKVSF
jgi:LemA protein